MSLLAKILVIFNLVLSLAFFGASTTMFFTRTEWRAAALDYKKQAEDALEQLESEYAEPIAKANKLAEEIARQQTKNSELATTNRQLQSDVKGLTSKISEVQLSQKQLAEAAEASSKLSERLSETNDGLNKRIADLVSSAETAEDARAEAQRDVTRIKLSYDQLKTLHSEVVIAKKDAEDALEQKEILLVHLKRKGIDVEDTTPQAQVDGQVEAVDLENELVVLSVGRDQGVREGSQFTVSRGGNFIGKVKVIQLYDDFAGARIIYAQDGDDIEGGDRILTPAF